MADRLRVLIVIDSLRVGGAEALLPTFLRYVDQSRFDVRVLALNSVSTNHVQQEIAGACNSLTQWPGKRLLNLARVRALAREIEAQAIDIVHSHLLYSNVQAAIAARLARRPIVATLHNVHQHNPYLKRKVEAGVLRVTGARAFAVSDGVRRSYRVPFGLSERQTTVVPNAIDLSRFANLAPDAVKQAREEALGGSPGPLVLAVGRIVSPKGFAVLARAAASIHERQPDARIAIAGRESSGLPEVNHEIDRLGLSGVVRLLGQRADVIHLLAAADVFVSPSLSEGAPLTHLEAMAAGAPVVATCVGGVPEIIRDGDNGLLVPAGQDQPLAAALLRVLEDRDLARRLSERGRETVREYGAEAWARRIEQEYLGVLASRNRQTIRQVTS